MKTFVKVIGIVGLTGYCVASAIAILALCIVEAANDDTICDLKTEIEELKDRIDRIYTN